MGFGVALLRTADHRHLAAGGQGWRARSALAALQVLEPCFAILVSAVSFIAAAAEPLRRPSEHQHLQLQPYHGSCPRDYNLPFLRGCKADLASPLLGIKDWLAGAC